VGGGHGDDSRKLEASSVVRRRECRLLSRTTEGGDSPHGIGPVAARHSPVAVRNSPGLSVSGTRARRDRALRP